MTEFDPYPDIEDAVRTLLLRDFATELPAPSRVGVDYPPDGAALPYVRVEKIAASQRGRLNDSPVLDIEVLAPTRAAAKALIERIDAHLLDYPHSVVISSGLAVLDMVTVPVAPVSRPWEGPNARRYGGTYQFSVRR
jgi:hypothetical protein